MATDKLKIKERFNNIVDGIRIGEDRIANAQSIQRINLAKFKRQLAMLEDEKSRLDIINFVFPDVKNEFFRINQDHTIRHFLLQEFCPEYYKTLSFQSITEIKNFKPNGNDEQTDT